MIEREIQAVIVRADLLILAVWPYARAALLAAVCAVAVWGQIKRKARRYR